MIEDNSFSLKNFYDLNYEQLTDNKNEIFNINIDSINNDYY